MRITAVNKTKKGRFALFVDGEFAFSVDGETLVRFGLAPQTELDQARLEQIRREAEAQECKEYALRLLSARSYPRRELFYKLARRCGEEAALPVTDRMEELGLINDEDYARRYAHDLFRVKGYGARRVLCALCEKGVDRELAQAVVSELAPDEEDTVQAVAQLIERRYKRYLTDRRGTDKTVRALMRMGYDYADIRTAISRVSGQDVPYEDDA